MTDVALRRIVALLEEEPEERRRGRDEGKENLKGNLGEENHVKNKNFIE